MAGEMALDLAGELNSNPDILNVQNGVIDLRTGQLDIHRPEYLCSKLAYINYMVGFILCEQCIGVVLSASPT